MIKSLLSCFLILITLHSFAGMNDGYLGVSVRSYDAGSLKALRIINVYDDGAAWMSGLMENDLIRSVNGNTIANSVELHKQISAYEWGDMIDIGYTRNGIDNEMTVILGHAANKKTYEILKSEQLNGEVFWYFDDNTTIVMRDGKAQSITKKFESGEKETLDLNSKGNSTKELPQSFLDLNDKLDVIDYTLTEQALRDKDADHVLFTKEFSHPDQTARQMGIESLEISEFEVYPNPSSGQFKVKILANGSGNLTWDIYDMRGSSISSGSLNDFNDRAELSFDLSSKFKGVYMLYFRLGDKKLSKQIILN